MNSASLFFDHEFVILLMQKIQILTGLAVIFILGLLLGLRHATKQNPSPAIVPAGAANQHTAPQSSSPRPSLENDITTSPRPMPRELNLDTVLASSQSETAKASELIELLGQTEREAQEDVARHLINLLDDDHFRSAEAVYTNASANPEVLNIFMHDLLNRPESVKLPVALAIAQVDTHPKKTEAMDILRLYFDQDYGTNWFEWQTAIEQKLAEEP